MTTDVTEPKIVSIRDRMEARQQEAKTIKASRTGDEDGAPTPKIYTVVLQTGEELEGFGILMVNGSFFAIGTPTEDGSGVDFSVAVPIGNVKYVECSEDFTNEEASGF